MAVSRRQASINQKAMAVLHQAMADEAELGFLARPLAVEPCIGIVVETCVSFDRFLPWKSASVLRPPPAGGSSDPSRGLKLFNEAHASISVPSTVKCSVDSSFFTRG